MARPSICGLSPRGRGNQSVPAYNWLNIPAAVYPRVGGAT